MKIRTKITCPLEIITDMIKGKWKTIIIWRLRIKPTSLAKLKRDINEITEKVLIENLKELINVGIVEKKEYDGYPLKVEYFLTERGERILEALVILQKEGINYMIENGRKKELIEIGLINTDKNVGN
ncbi:winged helix-turn-helix transcriptional regulator [Enterococcus hirae]|uniref:winged helix-turn-helix transcriptional regulator n=1 Tax=Enterococcus hirae TaxID=1354 RepID=UPI002090639D|nr:helix-turn-helix domain-containing protein [Enterococcus hirae]MCO5510967.1 helix-turn-helix transcriptional regulator [Enterococcus hirae]